MKSIYQNKQFAEFWNRRAGDEGEIYKRLILDPIMFKTVGLFKNKSVLEMGCGNGYLAKKFIKSGVSKLALMDISKYNIEFAKKKFRSEKIEYLVHDATYKWPATTETIDIVYSNMMLNHIKNINFVLKEVHRILSQKGVFIFSVIHPSFGLYYFAQEQVNKKQEKFINLGNYFEKGYCKYIMGKISKTKPCDLKISETHFEVEQFNRTLSDYFNALVVAGFNIKKIIEPPLNSQILNQNPGFNDYINHPVGLIFYCTKYN